MPVSTSWPTVSIASDVSVMTRAVGRTGRGLHRTRRARCQAPATVIVALVPIGVPSSSPRVVSSTA
jgi:hypothetical protein